MTDTCREEPRETANGLPYVEITHAASCTCPPMAPLTGVTPEMTYAVAAEDTEIDRIIDYINNTNHIDNLRDEARRLAAEVKRIRNRHEPPAQFFGGTLAPTSMSADARWHAVAAAAAGLLVHLGDDTPYAYPAAGQDTADFARDQLAHAAAAAIWALLANAVTTGDDHHFDTFTNALINSGRIPEAVAAILGPAFAELITAALPFFAAAINAPDEPEAIS